MNLQFYLEKLEHSKELKKFKGENEDIYLCSAFFVIDRENLKNPGNKSNIDFYSPSKNKMFSFQLDDGIKLVPAETIESDFNQKKPEMLVANSELGFEEIEEIISKEMVKRDIKNKIHKIMMVLQNKDGKDFWVCTVFISGFGLLKVIINDDNKKITFFDKKSFFDMLSIRSKKKK